MSRSIETHTVRMWLLNDEGLYLQMQELAASAESVDELARDIETEVGMSVPEQMANPARDLLHAALHQVDWNQIAQEFWDEREEDEGDEE